MTEQLATMQRPQRWDVPFGVLYRAPTRLSASVSSDNLAISSAQGIMSNDDVEELLRRAPFCDMDPSRFPLATPLAGILLNDTRLVRYEAGDLIIREGEYGNSAFLILGGTVRVCLESLPGKYRGQSASRRRTWWQAVAQLWSNSEWPEVRDYTRDGESSAVATRESDHGPRVFLQDVPGVLDEFHTLQLREGEMFGEMAVMSRAPRTATVFADESCLLLEIRWQGLRLLRRDPGLKNHLDRLYRENSLRVHLRETPLLKALPEHDLEAVAAATEFDSFGSFEWNGEYKQLTRHDPNERIAAEPLIVEEGHHVNDLLMIRNGFARVSQRHGHGHQTLAYLGKGRMFGMAEIVQNSTTGRPPIAYQCSLRAIGYVDVLRVPATVVQKHVLPHIEPRTLPRIAAKALAAKPRTVSRDPTAPSTSGSEHTTTALMEFLVEQRLNNGKQAMVIDLDRCVRCDDCVRACAATHDNNPRFVREGPRYDRFQFANACMHCADPVCMIGCPTGAIAREPETGFVKINDATCIGCSTCANNCPYHSIRMVEIRDLHGAPLLDTASRLPILKATKCDYCAEQIVGPACQVACGHDALIRIDLTETGPFTAWSNR